MRELFNINKEDFKKLGKDDRRFLLNINHNEFLFNESMLLQNRILVIAVFAVFIALLSLIIPLQFISTNLKIFVVIFLSLSSFYLLFLFIRAVKRVQDQNGIIKKGYEELFRYHFKYLGEKKK